MGTRKIQASSSVPLTINMCPAYKKGKKKSIAGPPSTFMVIPAQSFED
jgi:hypothetical protein